MTQLPHGDRPPRPTRFSDPALRGNGVLPSPPTARQQQRSRHLAVGRLLLLTGSILALLALALSSPPVEAARSQEKGRRPEEIVERALNYYGGRNAIYTIQQNGIYRALLTLYTPSGIQEGKTITKFIRKPKLTEDLVSLELELPSLNYSLTFDGKSVWSKQNGTLRTPTEQEVRAFRGAYQHHYEALLRFKESESKLELVGTHKIGTLDLDLIRLTSPEGVSTVYEVSRRSGHIIYLNYEELPAGATTAIKYRLYFKDFRIIQNTLIPFETQVFQDGKLIEERKIVEAVFNVQLDEKAFQASTDTSTTTSDPKGA
jgi:hypothetical protein